MSHSPDNEKLQWNSYLFKSTLDSFYLEQLSIFHSQFEKEWALLFSKPSYNLCQLESGNRLRPIIAFFGYLISDERIGLHANDYQKIVKLGVCIELIHKSSLIIDDMLDMDSLRNGMPTFHIANGEDNAIAIGIQLMCKSLKILSDALKDAKSPNEVSLKCLEVSITILNDMCTGLVMELSMNKIDFANVKVTEEIILYETSSIIKNSLILGYTVRGGDNNKIQEGLSQIGEGCGYIFQVMNDMEPYRNWGRYQNHKGKQVEEFLTLKKNIITSFILQLMNYYERAEFYEIHSKKEAHTKLLNLFATQKVYDHFMSEISELKKNITVQLGVIKDSGINDQWCLNFGRFIDSLIEVAHSRL
jgi:heptaprenyl diphosphate synthase